MRINGRKLVYVIYMAMIGVNMGLSLALLLSLWTWLEMRFNIGLVIPLGLLAGITAGLIRSRIRFRCGLLSAPILLITALIAAKGDFSLIGNLTGALFREGLLLNGLSLANANTAVIVIALGTVVIPLLLKNNNL